MVIDVLIPVLNEEESLPLVLDAIPKEWVRRVVVVDNGSTDASAQRAREHGACVVEEPQRGYGAACLRGLRMMAEDPPDVVVFLDGDFSDYPEELPRVVEPVIRGDAEMVIGSRTLGAQQRGALLLQAVWGNKLACALMELMYGYRFTDLGPFRAIRWEALEALRMRDEDFGWTVEMQIKAARLGLGAVEVPVSYRKRVGVSKVTGTVKGTVMASYKILYTLFAQYAQELREGGR
ncbi:UDP-glucose--dolichyl-phosphate glucosyltransferase [Lujinxingia litoralis]|uniref:UDP-glucose--dolichyl-phosphate glucosyltransferase n=1 Tax=Lujinxingia litoralis TaxID=2211119 RepID=A0A328C8Q3_9DELT|nr:glycosyltransferase family 2 protein [Lujinxingia litoralis]RAL23726.1 UDP-glucose--dolichyl-phosphate glucosyltransferase [Lujinxingia litoralis]